MFFGRKAELDFLESEFQKKRSSFVIVYGRRRVGKTTLIKEFIKNKEAIYFLATREFENENKKQLVDKISKYTKQPYLTKASFDKWDDIFDVLVGYKSNQKKILVIDEFQYLVYANSAFASIFQRIWDEKLQNENIMVILCGSYLSMMYKETLAYNSPLYGRRTGQIRLNPLSFDETAKFYNHSNFEKNIEYYAVSGGVPKYIELIMEEKELFASIENNILKKDSFLYEEPTFLMEQEVNEIGSYFSILKTISNGNHKLSQLASILEVNSNKITPYLKILMDLAIVEKKVPITEKFPEKSRKGLYFIKDKFILFWFKYVYPYKSELELGNTEYVIKSIMETFVEKHVSYIYEEISKEILKKDNTHNKLPENFLKIGSFWHKDIEIDIVGLNEDTIILGECKYTKKKVDISLYNALVKKKESVKDFGKYKKAIYVFFSKSGYSKEMQKFAKESKDIILYEGIQRI